MNRFMDRAKELLAETFAMDAHFDLAMDMDDRRERGDRRVWSARHAWPIKTGGWNCVVSSLFIHSWQLPEMGLRKALDQISALFSEAEEQPEEIALCTSIKEADNANAAGKTGILISFEGLDPLGNDPALLSVFYRLGVRAAGVAWSRRNYAADGCSFSPLKEGRKGGLTAFGVSVIEEAERLGMILDISHLNDEGVWDLAKFTKKPFIASHSNCRALVPVKRNLTDEQIKLVASRGGVIGMNGCSAFVSGKKGEGIGPADLALHIDHIVKLAGDDHVGLGLDCCDGFANFYEGPLSVETYDSIKGHSHLPDLVAVLLEKGYSDDSVKKIVGGNFRRVYEEVIG
ncbi:MAG: dipeptidase [Synergistaceae bacterium]|jgi:membrane dipeptidase|nr:dipeptidase [Synergistaceae bacterium]